MVTVISHHHIFGSSTDVKRKGESTFSKQIVVTTNANYALSVVAADVNGDGHIDLVSASGGDDKIAWYQNLDGKGTFSKQIVVTTNAINARSVVAADINGDGFLDLVSASWDDDKIAWYNNTDGTGTFGPQIVVTTNAEFARSVVAADINGDGHLDLVSASANIAPTTPTKTILINITLTPNTEQKPS